MTTFNPKKNSSKYIDMRSSFEDLVVRDLMMKTDLQSIFSFKRYKDGKSKKIPTCMHAVTWRGLYVIGRVGGFDSHHTCGR